MAIEHAGYNFTPAGAIHGIMETGPVEPQLQESRYPAVRGLFHLIGKPAGRQLAADLTLRFFGSRVLADSAITAINQQIGVLTGTLVVTGIFASAYGKCTFMGYQAEVFLDGSGVNGWVARGRLTWIQRDPTG